MNKISHNELVFRQSWTLSQKIDHSLYIIDAFLSQYPNSVIAYSGGIDSTVMMSLVRMIDKNRKAIFANTTNEFSDIVRFVKEQDNVEIVLPDKTFIETVKTEGFPLVSKKVARMIHDCRHPTDKNEATRTLYLTGIKRDGTKSTQFIIPKKYRHLLDVPFDITYKCCDFLKKKPMRELSKNGVFIGTMAENSRTRQGAYLQTGCIDINNKICKPMSIWTKSDIWSFTRQNNLKYCKVYDEGEESTGCAYCGFGCQFDGCARFDRLKKREKNRYELMMSIKNNGITYEDALHITFRNNKNK